MFCPPRCFFPGRYGTSFAFGLPTLAMMISSPAAARSTSLDKFVFAS
jgi:hypothetical protein